MSHETLALEEGIYHSQLDEAGKMPISFVLPQAFEPRYEYPLIVFFHGHGQSEAEWIDLAPRLSRRNYVCVGLRGPQPLGRRSRRGYGWGGQRPCDGLIEDYVLSALDASQRLTRIHTNRIFLVGEGEGASVAFRLAMTMPHRFRGVVGLNGWPSQRSVPFVRSRQCPMPSLFLGQSLRSPAISPREMEATLGLLFASGFDVEVRQYETRNRLDAGMLRDVDHWIMRNCQAITGG